MGEGVEGCSWGRGGGRRCEGVSEGGGETTGEGVCGWRGDEGARTEGDFEEDETAGDGVLPGGLREEIDEEEEEERGREAAIFPRAFSTLYE
jgi:hypothetical protein